MGSYTIFRSSKILGDAGKQEILQQLFQKFEISNRLPNRYFPKMDVGCPWFIKGKNLCNQARSSLVQKLTHPWFCKA